ncbi:MAG: hypothetical protein RMM17_00680 [Acidobacteriota bacterium]|nr:hypothetical protein [Blastocatellia bacterium]MDW8411182.1 hypothetical protein [Acidobacteriota bacterium]
MFDFIQQTKYLLVPASTIIGLLLGSKISKTRLATTYPFATFFLAVVAALLLLELSYAVGGRGVTLSVYALSMGFFTLAVRMLR